MNNIKNNLIIYILLAGFIVSAALGCIFYVNSMSMEGQHTTGIAKCCDNGTLFILSNHILPSILISVSLGLLFIIVINFLVIHLALINNFIVDCWRRRKRYDEFNYFNSFVLLFSQGIIHPKLF